MTDVEHDELQRIRSKVAGFPTTTIEAQVDSVARAYFVDPSIEQEARDWGLRFWLPEARTFRHFLYAYSALFGIPVFTQEALERQPDRFSRKRLPLTIRSTASFILDAFGFDRRTGRERSVLYAPGPVIRHVHAGGLGKARISDPAMAYFVAQLFRASERNSGAEEGHFDYVKSFLHAGAYAFPATRDALEDYIVDVDRVLAGNRFQDLWGNVHHAAVTLGVDVDLADFLPHHTASFYGRHTR